MTEVPASYFDGQSAQRRPVVVSIVDRSVVVTGDGVARHVPLSSVELSEEIGSTPRFIRFHDGAFCEVADGAALTALLSGQSIPPSRVSQWEATPWRWAAALTALVIVGVFAFRYLLPAGSQVVADRVPDSVLRLIGSETIKLLDRQTTAPSEIGAAQQQALRGQFASLKLPDGSETREYEIVFRKSALLGANAVALPSGTVIVTDDLIKLAKDERELLGVLAHEAGHVDRRHGLRLVVQSSAIAAVIAWFLGDVSTLVAAAPTALMQAKYSRDLEREADAYAAETLRRNGIDPVHLVNILKRIEVEAGSDGLSYLSSHPATSERLEALTGIGPR